MNVHRWIERARELAAASNRKGLLHLADRAWTRRIPAAEMYVQAAEAAFELGDVALSLRWLARADQASDRRLEAWIANLKGCALLAVGNTAQAERFFTHALKVAIEHRDRAQGARAVENLARAKAMRGDLQQRDVRR